MKRKLFIVGLFVAVFFIHQLFTFDDYLFNNWISSLVFAFWCIIALMVVMMAEQQVNTLLKKRDTLDNE